MQERLRGIWNNLFERWNGLDRSQKVKLSLTVAVVAIVLAATVYFITKPNMVELAGGLSYSDASQITKALTDEGIRNSTGRGGASVLVREKDVDTAQMLLADKNIPKDPGFTWPDALNASGMTATSEVKKENLRLSQETSLARKLTAFDGVDSAVVNLALADDNLFLVDARKEPSVSATLTTSRPLTAAESLTIARHVSRAVVGLKMENIELSNQNMETIYSGQERVAGSTSLDQSLENDVKRGIEKDIKAALIPLYPDVRVVSNIKLNMDRVSEITNSVESPTGDANSTGVVSSESSYQEQVTGSSGGLQPGVSSNDQTGPSYQTPDGTTSSATARETMTEYDYNRIQTVVERAPGSLVHEASSASIYLYKYKTYDQDYMSKNDLLEGMRWEDFKSENDMPVLVPVDDYINTIIDGLRIGTGIQNLTVTAFEIPQFEDHIPRPVQIDQIVIFGILVLLIGLLAVALIRRAQGETVDDIEPELAVEDLIVSDKLEQEKEEEMRLKDIEYLKESETKMQIEKFIQEKPEAVAALLRNWLNEEWE